MEVVKHEENGQVTLVTEVKKVDNKKEKIILRVSFFVSFWKFDDFNIVHFKMMTPILNQK